MAGAGRVVVVWAGLVVDVLPTADVAFGAAVVGATDVLAGLVVDVAGGAVVDTLCPPPLHATKSASARAAGVSRKMRIRAVLPDGAPEMKSGYVAGGCLGCGMQSSSYSAIWILSFGIEHAGHSGSRRTLNARNEVSSAS